MKSKTRYEYPDPTPVEVPFGFTYESLADTIAKMVKIENIKQSMKDKYVETFAESQDFDDDEPEFTSIHEMTDMQDEHPASWLTEEPEIPEALEPRTPAAIREEPPARTETGDSNH